MGYLKSKYTEEYFTNFDPEGRPKGFGVNGIEDFLKGGIRQQDQDILDKVNFRRKTVLDLGFGRGEALKYAVEHQAKQVTGVDFSPSALKLAQTFLKTHHIKADLVCDDILKFLKKNREKNKFDLILLLDVVEHIPRQELSRILRELPKILNDRSLIVINTPVFTVDNDAFKDGVDPRNFEDSDALAETKGMHINRYTKESLRRYMSGLGFESVSEHYFIRGLALPITFQNSFIAKALTIVSGFPLRFPDVFRPEGYEYAYSRKFGAEPNLSAVKKILRIIKWKFKALLVKLELFPSDIDRHPPRPVIIMNGPLVGRKLHLNLWNDQNGQAQSLGIYDQRIYSWLTHQSLSGKNIWLFGSDDVYHMLSFASLVGNKGKVVIFGEQEAILKRIRKSLRLNPDLISRLKFTRQRPASLRLLPEIIKIDHDDPDLTTLTGLLKLFRKHKPVIFINVVSAIQMYHLSRISSDFKYRPEKLSDHDGVLSLIVIPS